MIQKNMEQRSESISYTSTTTKFGNLEFIRLSTVTDYVVYDYHTNIKCQLTENDGSIRSSNERRRCNYLEHEYKKMSKNPLSEKRTKVKLILPKEGNLYTKIVENYELTQEL